MADSIESVFITGSNRGIGLELVRQFIELPNPPRVIIAGCRDPEKAQELKELKESSKNTAVHLVKLEVTNEDDIKAAAAYATEVLGDEGLTLLINNAGYNKHHKFIGTPAKLYIQHLEINTVAPIVITDNLFPLLKKAANKKPDDPLSCRRAAVINISATLGTFENVELNAYLKADSYRLSKNGLNYVTAMQQRNLRDHGILAVAICTGWVRTDMGGKFADLAVDDGVERLMKNIQTVDESHGGRLINHDGEIQEH